MCPSRCLIFKSLKARQLQFTLSSLIGLDRSQTDGCLVIDPHHASEPISEEPEDKETSEKGRGAQVHPRVHLGVARRGLSLAHPSTFAPAFPRRKRQGKTGWRSTNEWDTPWSPHFYDASTSKQMEVCLYVVLLCIVLLHLYEHQFFFINGKSKN